MTSPVKKGYTCPIGLKRGSGRAMVQLNTDLFTKHRCDISTPENPTGSCMGPREAACAAHYTYGRHKDVE